MLGLFIVLPLILLLIAIPIIVTTKTINGLTSAKKLNTDLVKKSNTDTNDILILTFGPLLTIFVGNQIFKISDNPWTEVNVNDALHAPIWPDAIPTFVTLILLSLVGYFVLNFIPFKKLPPLVLASCIGLLYLGIALSFTWSIQMFTIITNVTSNSLGLPAYVLMCLMPWNYALICLRVITQTIHSWNQQQHQVTYQKPWRTKLAGFLSKSYHLPVMALLLLLPILGVALMILTLFGQEPAALIKMWINTSDWTLSQKISPPSVTYDEHYLCTVGASGHRKIVKPLRMGVRHGHWIMVNRQLLVANAFEQVLEEKMPKTHRLIRDFYDRYGYPISRHIKKAWQADLIYFLMKPLEWFFLLVLYLVDRHPENRIALQYFIKPNQEVK